MQDALAAGATQTIHVLVPVCGERAEVARECLLRLLVAPEPVYMEKVLHLCDGGGGGGGGGRGGRGGGGGGRGGGEGSGRSLYAEEEEEQESCKMAVMVEQLRQLGVAPRCLGCIVLMGDFWAHVSHAPCAAVNERMTFGI